MTKQWFVYFFVAWFALLALTSLISIEKGKFYYAFDEKTPLIPQENTLLVKFTEEFDRVNMEHFLKESVTGIKIKWHNLLVAELSTESLRELENLKLKLESKENISSCHPFYKTEDGADMGVTNKIIIRFLPDVSDNQQKELHNKFSTEVIKTTKIYQQLTCPKGSDALDIANAYYETGLVEFSTPSFISYPEFHQTLPNDTYFGYQITCHNTGQIFNDGHSGTNDADIDAPEAWEITTGSSDIIIAVLDQGVTSNHPDLPNTRQVRLNGSDFTSNDNNPSPVGNENHGNACAGVIAATMNNNQGIAGIAPDCKIMPIRMSGVGPSIVADAIEFAVDNGADILSNSWTFQYATDPNHFPEVVTAIQYAVDNNCVVVFSAGNTADHTDNNDGYVEFPANVNIQGVITVGASDRDDQQANYSPTSDPGSQNNQIVDIVAPSHKAWPCRITGETKEMWTIDIPGYAGYNPWPSSEYCENPPPLGEQLPSSDLSYTGRFGGTSHSCPVVAGVAALVLSINPSLSNLEVFDILTSTADQVGGYTFIDGWCEELGHGRVNAYNAVCETFNRNVYVTSPSLVCDGSNATLTLHNRPPGATVIWSRTSNLAEVNGQGTDNYTVTPSGINPQTNGTVTANITINGHPCGNLIFRQKNLWVDRPGLPVTTPDGNPPMEVIYGRSYRVRLFHPPGAEASTGVWSANGSITITSGNTGPGIIFKVTGWDFGQWQVNTSNNCGISDTYTGAVYMPMWKFNMYPNPADDYVEIKAEKKEYDTKGIVSDTYEVKILNTMKSLVYQSLKTDQPLLRISTKSFINGIYFVHITAGEQIEVKQLIINH